MSITMTHIAVKEIPLFRNVDESVVRQFISTGFSFTYTAGTPIVIDHDHGETFFLLMGGMARISLPQSRDSSINVSLLKAGDFFGEMAILEQESTRTANVVAVTDVAVVTLQRTEFLKYMNQYPQLAINLARVLSHRLRHMNEKLYTMTLPDAKRICRTLLDFAAQGKAYTEDGPLLLPGIHLKDWVLFCGVSSESFMETMEKLRECGAVEWQNQRVVIKDIAMLSKYAL